MFQFHLQVYSWVNDDDGLSDDIWSICLTFASITTSFITLWHGIASYNLFQIYQHEPGFRSGVTYVLFNMYFQSSVFLLPLVKLCFTTHTIHLFLYHFSEDRKFKLLIFNSTANNTATTKLAVPKHIFILNCGLYLLIFLLTATLTHACIINKCKCNHKNLPIKRRIRSFIDCFEGHMIVNPLHLVFKKCKGCGHNWKSVQNMRKMYSQVILMYSSCVMLYSGLGLLMDYLKPPSECPEYYANTICKTLSRRYDRYSIFFSITLPLGALAFVLALIEYFTIVCCDLLIMRYAFDIRDESEGLYQLSEHSQTDITLEIRNEKHIVKDNADENSTRLLNSHRISNDVEMVGNYASKENQEVIALEIGGNDLNIPATQAEVTQSTLIENNNTVKTVTIDYVKND